MSRRAAEDLIREGRVIVDGKVAVLGDRCDPETSVVTVDGARLPIAPGHVTYLLSKPVGVVSTTDDPQRRRTVVDLVPPEPRVWPVGRLDADSEGLILLSNDGDLTNHVTHPSNGVTKTYLAEVGGQPGRKALRALTDGVDLDDGPARAISARRIDVSGDRALIEVVMGEGRNREVRRMCDVIGHPVIKLVRTAIGPIADRSLEPGSWRLLSGSEVAALYRYGRR
jgi:23S rRNA pseudouridine2605 synthase